MIIPFSPRDDDVLLRHQLIPLRAAAAIEVRDGEGRVWAADRTAATTTTTA